MSPDQVAEILRQLLKEAMIIAAPLLLAAALLSFLQTLTSLQEQSLTAVPRLFAIVAILGAAMPWFLHQLTGYTLMLYTDMGRYVR